MINFNANPENAVKCPFCKETPLVLIDVDLESEVRKYSDSPLSPNKEFGVENWHKIELICAKEDDHSYSKLSEVINTERPLKTY